MCRLRTPKIGFPGRGMMKQVPRPNIWRWMMFTVHKGDSILEWIILATIVVAVAGTALYAVALSIAGKLQNINVQIGS